MPDRSNNPMVMGLFDGGVYTGGINEPEVVERVVSSSSGPILKFAPVTLLTSGEIRAADPADAAIYGFAAEPWNIDERLSEQFPIEPSFTTDGTRNGRGQDSGKTRLLVFPANRVNRFTGRINGASPETLVGLTRDFAFAVTGITPTVAVVGTTGSTTYNYRVIPRTLCGNSNGTPTASSTTNGNATLSSTNYNRLTWAAQPLAIEYEIWKNVSGTYYLLGTVGGDVLQYDDTGQAHSTIYTLPSATNKSGYVIHPSNNSVAILKIERIIAKDPRVALGSNYLQALFSIPAAKSQALDAAAAAS